MTAKARTEGRKGQAGSGMSEALNSTGSEDVLSSIRRLVADDLRPVPPGTTARPAMETEKLLLTPALRVVSNEPAAQSAAPPIERVMARVSAGMEQQAEEWESETGDPGPDAEGAPMAENVDEADWAEHQIAAYAEPVFILKSAEERGEEPGSSGDEAGHDPASEPDEAAGLASQPDVVAPEILEATSAEDAAEALPGWAQSDGAEEAETVSAEPWVGGTVEPDRAWADEAEAAVLQELAGGARRSDRAEAALELDEADDPDLPVDEAMLREIVRDVLREELQGRLGERITRNIRKLVRAEIARAMAADELL